jgi:hypothetical protein
MARPKRPCDVHRCLRTVTTRWNSASITASICRYCRSHWLTMMRWDYYDLDSFWNGATTWRRVGLTTCLDELSYERESWYNCRAIWRKHVSFRRKRWKKKRVDCIKIDSVDLGVSENSEEEKMNFDRMSSDPKDARLPDSRRRLGLCLSSLERRSQFVVAQGFDGTISS